VHGPLARDLTNPGAATSAVLHHLGRVLATVGLRAGPPILGAALLAVVLVAVARRRATARLGEGARLVRVLAPPDVDPEGAATLWSNLVALLRPAWRRALGAQPYLGFELTAGPTGLGVALWVPGGVPPGLVERAVEAAWPGARTETEAATPPLHPDVLVTGGELCLADAECYPIRTEHRVDPLRPLIGALSGAGEEEFACVQVLARPVTGRRLVRLQRAAAARRNGRPARRAARLLDLVTPGGAPRRSMGHGGPAEVDPARSGDVAAILEKASQPCWAVTIRYAVATAATGTQRGPAAAAALRGQAHSVASAFAVYAGRNRFDRRRLRHTAEALGARRMGRGALLSVAELAGIAHLPTDVAVPGLARAGAKAVAPPPEVALVGRGRAETVAGKLLGSPKLLGDAEAGSRRPVLLDVADARHHLHVMGATGSGKSTLLTNLVLGDLDAGRGVVVIDPKGDLVTDLLDRLPAGAESRTVLIDPEEQAAPPILNVLEGPDPDLVVDNLVGIFRSIFEAYWGPRTDDVLRAACLTLLRTSGPKAPASLADVPRLLSDDAFRQPRTAAVMDDAVGLGGFWSWYEQMSEASRAQVIGPVLNKLRAFLLRDFVRQVVGRPDSSFDMGVVLDGGICLVRVPKGILGDDTARLLGSFVVGKVWQSATHRARLGQQARVDAALYVDECQNFLNLPRSFDELLAEARGYGLSMVLAHQHLAQLPRELREAVSSNARTKLWFSMSPEDAHALHRHVAPELSEHDLAHLGAYQAAARLVVSGKETPAFTLRTRSAPPATDGRAELVRAAARAAYGRATERTGDGLVVETAPEEMTGGAMAGGEA
jgi:hypothetical protein